MTGRQIARQIIIETIKSFDITMKTIKGKSRNKRYVTARQVAIYIIRRRTSLSLEESGSTVYIWIQAGTAGNMYLIECEVTASDGSVYEGQGVIQVKDVR